MCWIESIKFPSENKSVPEMNWVLQRIQYLMNHNNCSADEEAHLNNRKDRSVNKLRSLN